LTYNSITIGLIYTAITTTAKKEIDLIYNVIIKTTENCVYFHWGCINTAAIITKLNELHIHCRYNSNLSAAITTTTIGSIRQLNNNNNWLNPSVKQQQQQQQLAQSVS